jgi:hypothetical protein
MAYRYIALEQIQLLNICGYHDGRDYQEYLRIARLAETQAVDLVRRFQIKASRSPMQLIGFSFTL